MRLTEILKPECVLVPLASSDKQGALDELVDLLAAHCDIGPAQPLKDAVWQRESARTTGIGHGIGIPHGKTDTLTQLNMAIGLPPSPIEFGAIDGKPVDLIILLASPADQTGPHIQALAKISRLLTDDTFRDAIKQAESAEALYDMLAQQEAAIAGA